MRCSTGSPSVGRALGNGRRAEIVDLLVQAERSVEEIAGELGQSVANTSQHLQQLLRVGLVRTRRDGNRIYYSLASERVAQLWRVVREVAAEHLEELDRLAAAYLGDRSRLDTMTRDELAERLRVRRRGGAGRAAGAGVPGRAHRRGAVDTRCGAEQATASGAQGPADRRLLPRPVLRVCRRRGSKPSPSRLPGSPPRGRLPGVGPRRPAGAELSHACAGAPVPESVLVVTSWWPESRCS